MTNLLSLNLLSFSSCVCVGSSLSCSSSLGTWGIRDDVRFQSKGEEQRRSRSVSTTFKSPDVRAYAYRYIVGGFQIGYIGRARAGGRKEEVSSCTKSSKGRNFCESAPGSKWTSVLS